MKKCALAIILIAVSSSAFQCYYVRQGVALLDIYAAGRDIDRLLETETLALDERALLLLVKSVRRYAVDTLGLADNGNYTSYIRLDRDYLAEVVSACRPLSFDQYLWDYPFMGRLPYKGFLHDGEAREERRVLEAAGYDVFVRRVDAFSTLGILKDPVFSFMKKYPHYVLAELIIHEQTHATVFLDDQATFNENLASFVGEEGMRRFIRETEGESSEAYRLALALEGDRRAFAGAIGDLKNGLESLYREKLPDEVKTARKKEMIDGWKRDFDRTYADRFATDAYRGFTGRALNNAVIMTYMNYMEQSSEMRELYLLCGSDLPRLIRLARRLSKGSRRPVEDLREIIRNDRPAGN